MQQPGPEEEELRARVGTWRVTATLRPRPDAAPTVSDGLSLNHGSAWASPSVIRSSEICPSTNRRTCCSTGSRKAGHARAKRPSRRGKGGTRYRSSQAAGVCMHPGGTQSINAMAPMADLILTSPVTAFLYQRLDRAPPVKRRDALILMVPTWLLYRALCSLPSAGAKRHRGSYRVRHDTPDLTKVPPV